MLIIDPAFLAFVIYSNSIYNFVFNKYNLNMFQILVAWTEYNLSPTQ